MDKLTVKQIKNFLQKHKLKTTGNKETLFNRLTELANSYSRDVEDVIKSILEEKENEKDLLLENIKLGESASQISDKSRESRISQNSKISSVSSCRAAIEAKLAALMIKSKNLDQLENIEQERIRIEKEQEQERIRIEKEQEQERIRIEQKRRKLELEIELEAAEAEARVYEKFDSDLSEEEFYSRNEHENNYLNQKFWQNEKKRMVKELESFKLEKNLLIEAVNSENENLKKELESFKLEKNLLIEAMNSENENLKRELKTVKLEKDRSMKEMNLNNTTKREVGNETKTTTCHLQGPDDKDILKYLAACNLKGFMPKQELITFDGEYTKYFEFIRCFDSQIASKSISDEDRLQYLLQYTKGKPNKIVSACIHLDPSEGYTRARNLLDLRYGNKEHIATAYIEEILNWKEIGRDDIDGLEEYSIELSNCLNAMSGIQSGIQELDNKKTKQVILGKLPYNIRDRWSRRAHERKLRGLSTNFEDIVCFIQDEVALAIDPEYGKQFFKKPKNKLIQRDTIVQRKATINTIGKGKLICWYCKGNHLIENCDELKTKKHEEKLNILIEKLLCFSCLRMGHRSKECQNKMKCEDCHELHPTILHKEKKNISENIEKEVILEND